MSASEPVDARPSRPHDVRLVPAAVGAWVGMAAATSGDARLGVGVACAAAALVAVFRWRRAWRYVGAGVVVLVCLATGGLRWWGLHADPLAGLARERAVVQVELEVTGDSRAQAGSGVRPASLLVPAAVVELEGRGRAWASHVPVLVIVSADVAQEWRSLAVGQRVRAVVATEPAQAADPIAAVLRARTPPDLTRPPPGGLAWAERVRAGLRAAVSQEPPERAGLLPALVLGDTSALSPDLTGSFKTTALTHLSAVSGANLALLLAFVLTAARWIGIRGWPLRALTFGTTLAFVVLCRGEPSVLRAAAMGLVALAALGSGARDGAGLRSLAVACIALLFVDPWLSRNWGFALSVAASAGIVVLGRRWSAALQRWSPAWVAEAIAIPLAAQLATQPLITALSGTVSLAGLPANALAAPFVGPATVLGLAAALAAQVWLPLARVIAWAGCWCAQVIIWIARWGEGLPGASLQWPATPAALALEVAVCCFLAIVAESLLRRPLAVLAGAVALLLTLLRGPARPGWPPGQWDIVACDVGQGDGLVLRAGPGSAVVVDTGPDPRLMQRCLDTLGVTDVPLLVLTHDHADHTGGLPGVLRGRHVGLALESPLATPSRPHLDAELRGAGAELHRAGAGDEIAAGAVHWTTISTGGALTRSATGEGESSEENDASIIAVASVDGLRVLITGDAEPGGQDAALATGAALDCDVLKVSHHGSARQSGDFLTASHARVALISVGARNDYGHPTAKTLAALRGLGMTIVRTDERGAIAIYADRGEPHVVSEHDAVPVPIKGRR